MVLKSMVGHESHKVILEHFDCLAQFVLSSLHTQGRRERLVDDLCPLDVYGTNCKLQLRLNEGWILGFKVG